MALHSKSPTSPCAPLIPEQRWFPADEALRSTAYDKLLPPLVAQVRLEVFAWRSKGYAGVSPTSVALLRHWFDHEHPTENANGSLATFHYYFAQREAVETVIWLHEVRGARDKYDLLQKMAHLKQWCADVTAENNGQPYDFVFVDQNSFEKHTPKTSAALAAAFTDCRL